jgi:SNF2 family DNA or RNA helicase
MTPYEAVREAYSFPFELRPYQIETVNYLCPFERAGFYDEPGTGKTAMATHYALHWREQGHRQTVIVMPPILLRQWERWLDSVQYRGKPLRTTVYYGPPGERKKLNLESDFVLTTYGMLKNDFERLQDKFGPRPIQTLCDEAHVIKNIESQTHKAVKAFAEGKVFAPMTGTPTTVPGDSYAYIKLIAPGIYRNKRQFDRLHIDEVDEYGKVTRWANLDLLAANMKVQSSRILRRNVRGDVPPITYTLIHYDLAPAHIKLYRRIAEERLVEFDDGSEIDAISAQALRSALQQVIINWGEFSDGGECTPAGLELVEEVLDELGDRKLVVVANFRRTNAYLLRALAKYNAVAVYGDVTSSAKSAAIRRFIEDPGCRVILLQPQSAGFGVDGLQHVCSDMLVLEAPTTAPPFEQVVKRLDRDGQLEPVNCRIAVAQGTVQVRMFKQLLENDATVNRVQGGYKDLRDSIYGG